MKYRVTVETVTPLHIGTGTELLKDFDYVSKPGERQTYVLDQDAVYAAELEAQGAAARLDTPAGRLLSSENWREDSPFVRYSLQGSTTIERVHEQIKDVHGRCYLPGSSLKGALRTAVMAYAIASKSVVPDLGKLANSKEWAARAWEQAAFGNEPNSDVLKALHVSDSKALPLKPSALELLTAQVFTGGEPGSPIVVEAVRAHTAFETEVVIDELALKYSRDPSLNWESRELWLATLVEIMQGTARARIEAEWAAVQDKGFSDTATFYKQLAALAEGAKGSNMALLQLGWGTGWTGLTIGPWLDEEAQHAIRERYDLGRPPTARGDWQPNLSQAFPKSRRLRAVPSSVGDARPGRPLGWVAATFEPSGTPSSEWEALRQRALAALQPIAHKAARAKATVKPSQPQPPASVEPVTPTAVEPETQAPMAPRPAEAHRRPLTEQFSALPKAGDRFRATVIDSEPGGKLYAEIPGLSAEEVAMAVVEASDNPERKKYPEGTTISCEVIEVAPDPQQPGFWLVKCRRE
jgi:CRISPR-associated protein Csm5